MDQSKSSLERVGMCVFWCGFYPLNEKMWERKLQIKNNMNKQIEYQPNIGRNTARQHFYGIEEMKLEYEEYYNFNNVNNNPINFSEAIDFMKSLL